MFDDNNLNDLDETFKSKQFDATGGTSGMDIHDFAEPDPLPLEEQQIDDNSNIDDAIGDTTREYNAIEAEIRMM